MKTETKTVTVICDECGADMTNQNVSPDEKIVTWNGKEFRVIHAKTIIPLARPDDPTYDICKICRAAIYDIFQSM